MTQTELLTADDLLALGSDCRCELVDGVLVSMSPTAPQHGETASIVDRRVGSFVEQHGLGHTYAAETGFRLRGDPDTVRAPDFAFVARGRITRDMDARRYFDLAPDLAVEVVSPNDRATEMARNVVEYLAAGVRLVWVLYPELRWVAVHPAGAGSTILGPEAELSGGEVLPGFSCRVGGLFPGEPDA